MIDRTHDFACLLVPEPIMQLVLKRQWTNLLLLVRWHNTMRGNADRRRMRCLGPIADWPSSSAAVWNNVGKHSTLEMGDALSLNADTCDLFATNVSLWYPELIEKAGADEQRREARDDLLRVMHTTFKSWQDALRKNEVTRKKIRHDYGPKVAPRNDSPKGSQKE